MFEYIFDKAWSTNSTDVAAWLSQWGTRRYGQKNDSVTKAWHILLNTCYASPDALGQATLTNARPTFKGHGNWTTNNTIHYKNSELLKAWNLLINAGERNSAVYEYDVTNTGRQVLGNYFTVLRDAFTRAYEQKDLAMLQQKGEEMKALINDLDTLLSTHPSFLLGNWIKSARAFGLNAPEKKYYEQDAKRILTTWGEKGKELNEYANRAWAGLMKSYYGGRWTLFINQVIQAVKQNKSFDEKQFLNEITQWEEQWVTRSQKFTTQTTKNSRQLNKRLYDKYAAKILAAEE
jgi:alpha-N-acetylglucosaminidase